MTYDEVGNLKTGDPIEIFGTSMVYFLVLTRRGHVAYEYEDGQLGKVLPAFVYLPKKEKESSNGD